MTSQTIAVAFGGSADVSPTSIHALLNDWLGFGDKDADGYYAPPEDKEIIVLFPATNDHVNDSLDKVVAWTSLADLPYEVVTDGDYKDPEDGFLLADAGQITKKANVNKGLIDALVETEADERYLVLLWGEEGDENAENMMTYAEVKEIPVKDLSDGLDDLRFGDDEVEETPEPEPEPEPEPAPRARRGRRGAVEEPEAKEPESEPEKPARARRGRKEATLEAEETPLEEKAEVVEENKPEPVVEEKVRFYGPNNIRRALETAFAHFHAVDQSNAAKNLALEVRLSPITALLSDALHDLEQEEGKQGVPAEKEEQPVEAPKRGRGRPRETPVEEVTTGYLKTKEEPFTYRKAGRGRPPRGYVKVDLTPAQVAEIEAAGQIEAEED